MDKVKKETLEELMKNGDEEKVAEENQADEIILDEPKRRTWLIVLLSVLATLLMVGGAYVAYQSYKAQKQLSAEEKIETPVKDDEVANTTPQTTSQIVYVNAPEGLNLRKDASSSAEVLGIVPMGTKLTVNETSGDWYKVEYSSKVGWIAKLYTSPTDPLTYKNTNYGFQITFPADWGSYRLFPITSDGTNTAAYYVALVTSVATYAETGVDAGYASMFVLSVYTPTQWESAQTQTGPKPSLVTRNDKYVLGSTLPNGIPPEDLKTQREAASAVINTIKFY